MATNDENKKKIISDIRTENEAEQTTAEKVVDMIINSPEDDLEQLQKALSVPTNDGSSKKKTRNRKKTVKKCIFVAASLLLLSYLGLTLFFQNHYQYGTYINGVNCSYKTPRAVFEDSNNQLRGYFLTIYGRDGMQDSVYGLDINLHYEYVDSLDEILRKQNNFLWFEGIFNPINYNVENVLVYDEQRLKDDMDKMVFFDQNNIHEAQGASIGEYIAEEGKYLYIEGNPGTKIDELSARRVIEKAIKNLETELNLDTEGCYAGSGGDNSKSPLEKAYEEMNRYVSSSIIYDWNGHEVVLDGQQIQEFIEQADDEVSLNEEKVREFVSAMAKQYDTYGKARSFTTTDGRELNFDKTRYGWLTDKDKETQQLMEEIESGTVTRREPVWYYVAEQKGDDDFGNSYVEINLGAQHLYLYIDGNIVLESDFVSGNMSNGNGTPSGFFRITYKERNAVLRGANYATPVKYWMPFNNNVGMHDASWRAEFGGDIYVENGSHGCVNLPVQSAAAIYEYMHAGFPVICYY